MCVLCLSLLVSLYQSQSPLRQPYKDDFREQEKSKDQGIWHRVSGSGGATSTGMLGGGSSREAMKGGSRAGIRRRTRPAEANAWRQRQGRHLRSKAKVTCLNRGFGRGPQASHVGIAREPIRNEHPWVSPKNQELWERSPARCVRRALQVIVRHAQVWEPLGWQIGREEQPRRKGRAHTCFRRKLPDCAKKPVGSSEFSIIVSPALTMLPTIRYMFNRCSLNK